MEESEVSFKLLTKNAQHCSISGSCIFFSKLYCKVAHAQYLLLQHLWSKQKFIQVICTICQSFTCSLETSFLLIVLQLKLHHSFSFTFLKILFTFLRYFLSKTVLRFTGKLWEFWLRSHSIAVGFMNNIIICVKHRGMAGGWA